MLDIAKLKIGDKVHYQPSHYGEDKWENGLVKIINTDIRMDAVWVVYNCAGEWDRYQDYTSACTRLVDLKLGWRH